MDFRPCVLIPCYNHGETIPALLDALAVYGLPVLVVNDGSRDEVRALLIEETERRPQHACIHLEHNQGKGAAVIAGLREAQARGFTHVLQIDADGQHDTASVSRLLDAARKHPGEVISGRPVFDESIPKIRYYGRYLTHALVWLETLSFRIRDSMCGFRVYPINPLLRLVDATPRIGLRMDFETEILVRFDWAGVYAHFVDTPVIYPEGGISHFHYLRDNIGMVRMHTRLVLGMLWRLPRWILRRLVPSEQHWSRKSERGTVIGIRFMLFLYALMGRRVFGWFLRPVIFYYYLTAHAARAASCAYLDRVRAVAAQRGHAINVPLTSYRHILSFGYTILDNMVAWREDIKEKNIVRHGWNHFDEIMRRKKGAVVIGAHLGSMEVCRAMSHVLQNRQVNALVFTRHAKRFNVVMQALNSRASLNIIQVDNIGPDTAILLKQKLEQGEWVVFVGDRTSITSEERVIWTNFLGDPAPFPQGPFILASILEEPVYLLLGLREDKHSDLKYHIYFESLSEGRELPRDQRERALKELVARYAERLESHVLEAPLQWYNFFNFWSLTRKNHD